MRTNSEQAKAWRAANPEKARAYRRRYNAANKSKVKQWGKDWEAAHREERNERRRQWNKKNPGKRLAQRRLEALRKTAARSIVAVNAGL